MQVILTVVPFSAFILLATRTSMLEQPVNWKNWNMKNTIYELSEFLKFKVLVCVIYNSEFVGFPYYYHFYYERIWTESIRITDISFKCA